MTQFGHSNRADKTTGIQSELAPIRTFVLYRWEDERIFGYEVTHKPYPASTEGYECTHIVLGKRARFAFISHDPSITRRECIHFGSALVNGTFTVFHCDLSEV
jgi:hypothetical protein